MRTQPIENKQADNSAHLGKAGGERRWSLVEPDLWQLSKLENETERML